MLAGLQCGARTRQQTHGILMRELQPTTLEQHSIRVLRCCPEPQGDDFCAQTPSGSSHVAQQSQSSGVMPCLHRMAKSEAAIARWCRPTSARSFTCALHIPLHLIFNLAMTSLHTVRADHQAVLSAFAAVVLLQTAVAIAEAMLAAADDRRCVSSADPIHAPCFRATAAHQPPCCTLQPSASGRRAGQAEAGL